MRTTVLFVAITVSFITVSASAAPVVIDNGDFGLGYAVSAVTEQGGIGDAFSGDQAFNTTGGDLAANATYTFSGLADGIYDVFASWRLNGQANADFMQVAVSDGGPTVSFDQRNIGPLPDLVVFDGTQNINFQRVGSVTVTDTDVVATTSLGLGGAQQFFINDAIAIDLVSAIATVPEPSTAFLALIGLLGVAACAWRRKRAT